MATQVLPDHFRPGLKQPSARVRSYQSVFSAQTDAISNANSSSILTIHVPGQMNTLLDPSQSYLRIAITVASANAQLEGCAAAVIRSLTVTSTQSGNQLDVINAFNLIYNSLIAVTGDQDSSAYGLGPLVGTSETNPRQGTSISSGATREFCIPLLGVMGLGCSKCFFNAGFTIQIQLEDAATALFAATGSPNYSVSRVAYVAQLHELPSDLFSALVQSSGGTMLIPASSWRQTQSYGSTATSQSFLLGHRYTSIKTLLNVMRRVDALNSVAARSLTDLNPGGVVSQYQFRLGSELMPPQPPSSYSMYFANLLSAFHAWGHADMPTLLTWTAYTRTAAFATASPGDFAGFLTALDLEPSIRDKAGLLNGYNSLNNVSMWFDIQYAAAPSQPVLDSFALIDVVVSITPTGAGGVAVANT